MQRLQRLCDYIQDGLSFNEAMELVRASSLYTVHTPVPAGHDYFEADLFGKYMGGYPEKLGISWDEFIGMGRINADDHNEKFCMSVFACNTCQEVNGVSKLHGWVSQKILGNMWKGYYPGTNHVGYVTNGVHFPTWIATSLRRLYARYFADGFEGHTSTTSRPGRMNDIPRRRALGDAHGAEEEAREVYPRNVTATPTAGASRLPRQMMSIIQRITPNALMIGFCRRFATYKRAHLLFTDLDRLEKIVNNKERPVQFIFAGKAHPNDKPGQDLIKRIVEVAAMPQFLGKIIFLEDYDMRLARRLVSGVDIWMNTPTRPLEASGTSGEKCVMNGVMQFSVLDGWWVEGYKEGAGWALPMERTFTDQHFQDELDAEMIYNTIEEQIVPLYKSATCRASRTSGSPRSRSAWPRSPRTSRPTACSSTTKTASTTSSPPASACSAPTPTASPARSRPGSARSPRRGTTSTSWMSSG